MEYAPDEVTRVFLRVSIMLNRGIHPDSVMALLEVLTPAEGEVPRVEEVVQGVVVTPNGRYPMDELNRIYIRVCYLLREGATPEKIMGVLEQAPLPPIGQPTPSATAPAVQRTHTMFGPAAAADIRGTDGVKSRPAARLMMVDLTDTRRQSKPDDTPGQ